MGSRDGNDVPPRQRSPVFERLSPQQFRRMGDHFLIGQEVVRSPQVSVGQSRGIAVPAEDRVTGVLVAGAETEREGFLHLEEQVRLAGARHRLDVQFHAPERVIVGPREGTLELAHLQDAAPLNPHFFAEQRLAEPAVAFEFHAPHPPEGYHDAQRARRDVLRRHERRRHREPATFEVILDHRRDRREELLVDHAVLPGFQPPVELFLLNRGDGNREHHETFRGIVVQLLNRLRIFRDDHLTQGVGSAAVGRLDVFGCGRR